jgi:hypothetical protein
VGPDGIPFSSADCRAAVVIRPNCARYGLPVESGSVADWVNAVGTLLAFLGAASAAIIAWNSYRTQLRQTALQISALEQSERHRQVEQERAQASKVAFWVGVTARGPGVAYVNLSGLPVYDISVHAVVPGRTFTVEYQALGPTPQEIVLGRVRTELIEGVTDDRNVWHDLLRRSQFSCVASFRDASDHWWIRDRHGRLIGQESRATLSAAVAAELPPQQDAS